MHREIDWLDHVIQLKMFQRSELIDYSVADWLKRKLKISEKWLKNGIPLRYSSCSKRESGQTIEEFGLAPLTRNHLLDSMALSSSLVDQFSMGNWMTK